MLCVPGKINNQSSSHAWTRAGTPIAIPSTHTSPSGIQRSHPEIWTTSRHTIFHRAAIYPSIPPCLVLATMFGEIDVALLLAASFSSCWTYFPDTHCDVRDSEHPIRFPSPGIVTFNITCMFSTHPNNQALCIVLLLVAIETLRQKQ